LLSQITRGHPCFNSAKETNFVKTNSAINPNTTAQTQFSATSYNNFNCKPYIIITSPLYYSQSSSQVVAVKELRNLADLLQPKSCMGEELSDYASIVMRNMHQDTNVKLKYMMLSLVGNWRNDKLLRRRSS